jgi:DNA-binding Lrp family transcriptional regulator
MKTIRAIIKLRCISMDSNLKVRAKRLEQMREVVENKIRKLPRILKTELMTVLKTRKEEQIVSLKKDISVYENSSGIS